MSMVVPMLGGSQQPTATSTFESICVRNGLLTQESRLNLASMQVAEDHLFLQTMNFDVAEGHLFLQTMMNFDEICDVVVMNFEFERLRWTFHGMLADPQSYHLERIDSFTIGSNPDPTQLQLCPVRRCPIEPVWS